MKLQRLVYGYGEENSKIQEHLARYFFVQQLVTGKHVIDVGCGARRGPMLLAETAQWVCASDISLGAIFDAARQWSSDAVAYLVADACNLPIQTGSLDGVVALEVIEHLPYGEIFLQEMRRVVRAHGIVVLSTPNKAFTQQHGCQWHDHVREFDGAEFTAVLGNYFSSVRIYSQGMSVSVLKRLLIQQQSVAAGGRMPLWGKRICPPKLKDALYRAYQHIAYQMRQVPQDAAITCDDFPITAGVSEEAYHFIAVCCA